jgi:nitrous oxidase accessory protein NosD
MRSGVRVAVAVAVLAACLVGSGTALAMKTVCASGCAYSSIQSAVDAASEGATITIGKATFQENVVVDKPVTLQGSGKNTVVEPAVSNPVCSGGSLCEGSASNIILVQADNVTIKNMRLEGDNPSLTSGVVVGGKDIDARNGIITNHLAGTYNNLTVAKVTVADIYLRGIYASSGGTFDFNHDTVSNVQGEEASIAMFDFEGAGSMDANKVTEANDAISANWSKGTEFAGNKITKSGSGVHTDNNGGSGGVADVISGNKISECKEDGSGIFVFVPYVSATVSANKVTGCARGLAVYGGAVSGEGPTFSNNTVKGTGAKTSDPNGSYGVYLTTDQLGYAFGDMTATLKGNLIEDSQNGMFVTQSDPSPEQPAGGQATVTAHGNSFKHNPGGAKGEPGTVVEAQENWWGCTEGPNSGPKCDPASGTVAYVPFLAAKP